MTGRNLTFYAVPNGGKRNILEGSRLKRCGVRAGVPDLCIPIPHPPYHGLYIELKRENGGTLSPYQTAWIEWLNAHGYCARVARGAEAAKKIICEYMGWPQETK